MQGSHTILVTGGAGFVGSGFVHLVLAEEPETHVVDLDLLTYAGSEANLEGLADPARHHFVRGDISDADLVRDLLAEHDVDAIVHFAAESHVDRSIDDAAAFVRTNLTGTHVLLEAALDHWRGRRLDPDRCRFHHVSTDEVFGTLEPEDPPFTETTAFAPNSPYAATKAGSDHLVRAYGRTYGLPVTTTHGSNNYGPRQHAEKLIPTVIRAAHLRQPIPVYGDGAQIRDWIHVDDHCRAVLAVLRRGQPGQSYLAGTGVELPNLELVRRICGVFDDLRPRHAPHAGLIEHVDDRPAHDRRYSLDPGKLREELAWSPRVELATGLRDTVSWYLESEHWRSGVDDGSIGGERLGLAGAEPGAGEAP